jgi:hypothetical protein
MSPPFADRLHEDRSGRDESRAADAHLLRAPKLSRLLRAANMLICLTAVVYFLSFLRIVNARVSDLKIVENTRKAMSCGHV